MTNFKLNHRPVSVNVDEDTPLLWVIRDEIGLKGTKFGCGIGMCGACTVHVEGRAIRSCITPRGMVAAAAVTTIEGRDPDGRHPLQRAWIETQAPQCGYCQSGQIMQAAMFETTIWYRVDRSGAVPVSIIKAEMGQHIGTALARILADELEVDWEKVRLDYVDTDPKWGLMLTGASWSVWQTFMPFSQAGAAGRIALLEEGAKLLNVNKTTCSARNGAVGTGDRSITYGDIVARGSLKRTFTADQLKAMPIKNPADRRLIGHDTNAIDIPTTTNRAARYGIDAAAEGMVYARPKIPATRYGSKVVSIDDSAAKSVKGYIKSI